MALDDAQGIVLLANSGAEGVEKITSDWLHDKHHGPPIQCPLDSESPLPHPTGGLALIHPGQTLEERLGMKKEELVEKTVVLDEVRRRRD
jgi:hypothetical protein